jgi:hypothetical protein
MRYAGRTGDAYFLSNLDDRGRCLCTLIPAARHRQASVDQLLFDHLPPANLLVFVDGCSSAIMHSHVGQIVGHLQLIGTRESLGFGFGPKGLPEVGH